MISRNNGKAYQPVLCWIKMFAPSGKSVIVIPFECTQQSGYVLPFKHQTVLLQTAIRGNITAALEPASMSPNQKADFMESPWVIAWIQKWLFVNFEKEGRPLEVMTPSTPVMRKIS